MIKDLPLTLLEEFLLFALDDETQDLHPLPAHMLDCATAGAILMDLTLRIRIDNDLKDMFVVDPTPTGDGLLDPVLQLMSMAPVLTPHPIAYWLRQFADEAKAFREKALRRLEERGFIRRHNLKILWMFESRRYPGKEIREVRSRLLEVILQNAVPTPHDVMLTSLAEACGLFRLILGAQDYEAATPRIVQVAQMDLIGQAVTKSVADIESVMSKASGYR